jgi:hypothetical protein
VIETRKDSAVHVSLSSFSLVKQPETRRPQLSEESEIVTETLEFSRLST